ncbi:hypothetical protein NP493_141g04013 [Ridgeia piscesae]|uniref:Uncharacterized protein n=1 Tax=Ridgeia piscesae TaxID=27915 RepID=A0AAD9UG49_RIDPI|nr:hypothetical protein NP493_141g04013 [Ridgeia piscesae]
MYTSNTTHGLSTYYKLTVPVAEHWCRASESPDPPQDPPQPQGNNSQTDTSLSPSVSVTQTVTQAVTQPLTVVTPPVTQAATQEVKDSVSHAPTSVEPAGTVSRHSSDVDTDTKRSTPSGTTLVTMTTTDVTTPVLVTVKTSDIVTSSVLPSSMSMLSPALSVSVNISVTRTYDVTSTNTVSPAVTDATQNVSSSRVSPELSSSTVLPKVSSSSVSPNMSSSSVAPELSSSTVLPKVSSSSVSPNMSSSSVSPTRVSPDVSSSSVTPNMSSSSVSPKVSPSTSLVSLPSDVSLVQAIVTSILPNMSTVLISSSVEVSTQPSDTLNTSTVPDIDGSVTTVESMSPTVTPPISTPTVTLDNMTSVINVSTSGTTDTMSTVVDTSTLLTRPTEPGVETTTTAVTPTDRVYKLTFDGNCSLLDLPGFREQFVKVLSSLIKIKFKITDNSLKIAKNIKCGSLTVEVQIFNLTDPSLDNKMETLSSINVTAANVTFYITLLKVALVPATEAMSPTTEAVTPTTERPFLYQFDKLLVIVFSIVGGTLLVLAIVVAFYSCRTRRHKSFDLGDTPTANVRLEDFTLTKMTRSHPMYSDQGVIVSLEPHDTNSDTKAVSPGSVYQGQQGYFPKTTGPLSTFQPQRLVAVENGGDRMDGGQDDRHGDRAVTGRHGSDENLTDTFQAVSPSRTGFDNPSFSSEDILDSGTDDNVEDLQQPSELTEGATPF